MTTCHLQILGASLWIANKQKWPIVGSAGSFLDAFNPDDLKCDTSVTYLNEPNMPYFGPHTLSISWVWRFAVGHWVLLDV